MSEATYIVGDVFDVMATLPDSSVDLVLTSPPFLALRSYLPADHPDKGKEIGSEPTPAEFIDTLLALTAEWERVLAPHGSICVELGDTYAGGGNGPDARNAGADHESNAAERWTGTRNGWPMDKSLTGIPTLYAWSLAYGRNLLTGEPSPAGQWRIRNVVAWCRPNPPVGALGDKYRQATSYITIATKARDRWFDLDAVRTAPASTDRRQAAYEANGASGAFHDHSNDEIGRQQGPKPASGGVSNPAGAPPLDWWQVPTEPYKGSHYATWPRKLLTRPIESMCPREVCTACGEPRRRIVENHGSPYLFSYHQGQDGGSSTGGMGGHTAVRNVTTTGWTDCECGAPFRPGIVLDPFAGSGTTLAVATGLGRDAIGIDIDKRNLDLACERVGMFLKETT